MATRRNARTGPRVGAPRPPVTARDPVPATVADHDLEPESVFKAVDFHDFELADRQAESAEFSQCRFRAASLAGSHLDRVRLTDCRVERCDWSNLRAPGGTMDRVAVSGSRMTGLAWTDGLLRDVSVSQSKLDLTNWRFARFEAVEFADCSLPGADFTNADLRGAVFTRCDLTGAKFDQATMRGTRFRGCELAGIGGIASWEGAVVHRDDLLDLAYALAGALGIEVDETVS